MKLKNIQGRFAVVAVVMALYLQFVTLQNYIYDEVFKEWTYFTNNAVWLFAIGFLIGAVIHLLCAKYCKENKSVLPVLLIIWSFMILIIGFFSVYVIQVLFHLVKVNSVTIMIPLMFGIFVMVSGGFLFTIIVKLKQIYNKEKESALPLVFIGLIVASVLDSQLLTPKHLSYNALFIIVAFFMLISSLTFVIFSLDNKYIKRFVEKFVIMPVECLVSVDEDCQGNHTEDTSNLCERKCNNIIYSCLLVVMIISGMIYVKNINAFSMAYDFTGTEISFGFVAFPVIIALLLYKFDKIRNTKVELIVGFAVYAISLLIIAFVSDYITFAIFNMFIIISFISVVKRLYQNIDFSKCNAPTIAQFAFKVIVLIGIPAMLGYMFAVWMTEGFGYMFDIFAGIYIQPFRGWSEYARGIKLIDGVEMKYAGLGEVVKLAHARDMFIPSNAVMFISMSAGFVGVVTIITRALFDKFEK